MPIGTQMASSESYKKMQAIFLDSLNDCQQNIRCIIKDVDSGSVYMVPPENESKSWSSSKLGNESWNIKEQLSGFGNHLEKMKKRISDNSRKILVTGDVNSGKSTFINALLHEDILPIDQQPCTQSFCEIELSDITSPQINDTKPLYFGIYKDPCNNGEEKKVPLTLSELQESIQDQSEFTSFKIILDSTADASGNQSKLCLIDSPGLNSDLFKTVALHALQEDIDIVVLILNAANHLTLSSRSFLELARREKLYIFLVVNKFDEIKKEEKCRANIMSQISEVLPETFAKSTELVHFVSAKLYHEYYSEPKSPESIQLTPISTSRESNYASFNRLMESLKCFIYEKDYISKLLPAATLLRNIIKDVLELLKQNFDSCEENMKSCLTHFEIVKSEFDAAISKDGLCQSNMAEFLDKIKAFCQQQSQGINQDVISSIESITQTEVGIFAQEFPHVVSQRASSVFSSSKEGIDKYINIKTVDFENLARIYIPESSAFWESEYSFSFKESVFANLHWPRPRLYDLVKLLTLDWRQNWLSVTALSSALIVYQPFLSSLSFVGSVLRMSRAFKIAAVFSLTACTIVGTLKLCEYAQDCALKCYKRYYLSYFTSSEWLFNLNDVLEKGVYDPFFKRSSHLVNEFVGFLRQQRELKANAELKKVRLEGLREYFSTKINVFSLLLDRIPQSQYK